MTRVADAAAAAGNGQVSDPKVHLDLDTLEREAKQEVFTFVLEGHTFHMRGPDDVDWQVQGDLDESSTDSLRTWLADLLGEGEYERFVALRVPMWKLGKLIEACYEHYGVTGPESVASQRSSKRTAKR